MQSDRETETQTNRQNDKQPDRETETQTDRQKDMQSDRETETQTDRQKDKQPDREIETQTDRQINRGRDSQAETERHAVRQRDIEGFRPEWCISTIYIMLEIHHSGREPSIKRHTQTD